MGGANGNAAWRRILVATDFSPKAGIAQRSAELLAREIHGEIVLVHVIELPSEGYVDRSDAWVEEAQGALRSAALRSRGRGARVAEADVRTGKPWLEIVAAAWEHGADLVVLGNSGRSRFERLLLGSTAENVVRHSTVPVLVIRSRPLRGLRRVLVPVSFDEGSRRALAYAAWRMPRNVRVEAFHAAPATGSAEPWMPVLPPSIGEVTAELRAFVDAAGARRFDVRAEISDSPAMSILRRGRAWKADLILLSTHGRGGLAHVLLGSVAEKVARYADRPVLVLPPAARERSVAELPALAMRPDVPRAERPESVLDGDPRPRPLGRRHPGPWTGQAHTGRGGPKGRRGGTRGKKKR